MIEALIGIVAVLAFVLVVLYVGHRQVLKTKHAH